MAISSTNNFVCFASGTVNSSLTLRPSALLCAKRRWWASAVVGRKSGKRAGQQIGRDPGHAPAAVRARSTYFCRSLARVFGFFASFRRVRAALETPGQQVQIVDTPPIPSAASIVWKASSTAWTSAQSVCLCQRHRRCEFTRIEVIFSVQPLNGVVLGRGSRAARPIRATCATPTACNWQRAASSSCRREVDRCHAGSVLQQDGRRPRLRSC